MLRYLLVLVEGGIYSDTDTRMLKTIDHWGQGSMDFQGTHSTGPPSVIVGIEADVGGREDWHNWWARPVQVCQWTFASAPYHPIFLDAVRRIYEGTVFLSYHENADGKELEEVPGFGSLKAGVGSLVAQIMEWTGPGVFTDSVMRYLAAGHGMMWPSLKDRRVPLRFQETVVLPVTGFSPGVKLFGAGEIYDEQAMVHHMFAGSWKPLKGS
ncbi:uncharacterized protein EI90DRAFT_3027053 [Cantharellus anzutake]|uniref:uncharacterized protein n=1 Tax=Cantharellus anzutake TaxID=1750568 RepID=UPI0019047565|nr:uncharacterized protein EI90DRAFT_3027053 [Cantharellus anzutake]KAF8343767.1 hypothetical protein EI90DRAFT_3027053 [Cantharellus anzutake]